MKALQRAIVGSAFGVLAAAAIAASAAYACHPKASVAFSNYHPMPGEHVRVWGYGFDAQTTVKIWFGERIDSLVELDSAVAQAVDRTGRPQIDLVVRIPPEAVLGRSYVIAASQEGSANPGYFRDGVTIGPKPSVPSGGAGPATEEPKGSPTSVAPPPVGARDVSAGGSGGSAPSVTVAPAPAAVLSDPSKPAGASGSATGPVVDAAVLTDRVDDAAPDVPAQAPIVPAAGSPGAPHAEDLWSGLDPAQVPALLDAPATPPQQGGAAVGVVLLGLGLGTLACLALSLGRRRLALATHG